MRISAGIVGTTAGPRLHAVDARWLMAYAAALGETAPEYLDTLRPEGILAHPLFPVCYEWPVAVDLRAATVPQEVAPRGVHATHDLRLHRRPRPGDRLRTTATVSGVEARKPGAYVLIRLETVDAAGEPVSTTDYGTLYLGVACDGPPAARRSEGRAPAEGVAACWSHPVAIPATLGHIYSECARIWNPIHTDRAFARAADLPDVILHGTATLALAVSEVLRREAAGPATPVVRIACRFAGMVRIPSTVRVRGLGVAATAEGRRLRFDALADDGTPAIGDGELLLGE
ncbi:MAG: MaoC family dehydratase N-terminal domain-containing protein [Candidatus Rokubacteria bacterium]|nr:MaoC family dehydratase N-terminal domain-containing protein [Candidatus Rokubacteria bacterium]